MKHPICIAFVFANFLLVSGYKNDLLKLILIAFKGVSLNGPGTVIKIGLVTVPFDTVCKTRLTEPDFCRVCMLDCKFAHKATSGSCGPHPTRRDETTCVCDYTPKKDLPTVSSICPASYSLNLFGWEWTDQKYDLLVKEVLRIRFQQVLCSKILSGCETDCINNHGAYSGACLDDYCICNYSKRKITA